MSWKKVKLGDLLEYYSVRAKDVGSSTDLEFCGVSKEDGITISKYAAEDKAEEYKVIEKGCFAYNPYRINVGSIALMQEDKKGLISPAYVLFKPKPNSIIPKLLLKYLKSAEGLRQIKQNARGTVRQALRFEDLCKIEITLPKYEEQLELYNNLELTQNKCDSLNLEYKNQLDLLKKLRQQILQDAVQGKLVPQDLSDEPASVLLEQIKAEKEKLVREKKIKKEKPLPPIKPEEIPFEIPENWVWCRLGEAATISGGFTLGRSFKGELNTIPYLRVANVQRGYIDISHLKYLKLPQNEIVKYLLNINDILVNEGGDFDKVGRCAVWNGQIAECIHQNHLFRISSNFLNPIWLQHVINSDTSREYFLGAYKKSTNLASINRTKLTLLPIPIPPILEQNRMVISTNKILKVCDELEQTIQQNQKYTKELLQVALKEALEPKIN